MGFMANDSAGAGRIENIAALSRRFAKNRQSVFGGKTEQADARLKKNSKR
jgi:hypothetical protein